MWKIHLFRHRLTPDSFCFFLQEKCVQMFFFVLFRCHSTADDRVFSEGGLFSRISVFNITLSCQRKSHTKVTFGKYYYNTYSNLILLPLSLADLGSQDGHAPKMPKVALSNCNFYPNASTLLSGIWRRNSVCLSVVCLSVCL